MFSFIKGIQLTIVFFLLARHSASKLALCPCCVRQFICMAGCKLLPFGIHVRGVVFKCVVLEGTFRNAKLLYKLAHLVVGEYLLQLRVSQLLGVVLQFQKPLYTLFIGHHIAFEFELKYVLIFSKDCFKWE